MNRNNFLTINANYITFIACIHFRDYNTYGRRQVCKRTLYYTFREVTSLGFS